MRKALIISFAIIMCICGVSFARDHSVSLGVNMWMSESSLDPNQSDETLVIGPTFRVEVEDRYWLLFDYSLAGYEYYSGDREEDETRWQVAVGTKNGDIDVGIGWRAWSTDYEYSYASPSTNVPGVFAGNGSSGFSGPIIFVQAESAVNNSNFRFYGTAVWMPVDLSDSDENREHAVLTLGVRFDVRKATVSLGYRYMDHYNHDRSRQYDGLNGSVLYNF